MKNRKTKDSVSSELGLAFILVRGSCLASKEVMLLDLDEPSAFPKLSGGPFYGHTMDKGTAEAGGQPF